MQWRGSGKRQPGYPGLDFNYEHARPTSSLEAYSKTSVRASRGAGRAEKKIKESRVAANRYKRLSPFLCQLRAEGALSRQCSYCTYSGN